MDSAYVQIATRLLAALLAGGMIGLRAAIGVDKRAFANTRWCAWRRAN